MQFGRQTNPFSADFAAQNIVLQIDINVCHCSGADSIISDRRKHRARLQRPSHAVNAIDATRRRVAELANCLFSRLMTLIFCHVGLVVCSVTAINRWSVRLAVICQSGAVLPDEALRGARGRFQARACVNDSHRAVRV